MLVKKHPRHLSGFTLFELIIVIAVIGILSVALFPQWPSGGINVNIDARRLLNDIRYTQALSMLSGERYRLVGLSTATYQITNEAGTPVVMASGGTVVSLSNGVSFSSSSFPSGVIVFDSQGIPYITTGSPGTALASQATITLSNGTQTRNIVIYPQTGYGVLQ